MNDIVVIKATNHVHNSVRFPNVSEELIPEAFSLGSTLYQPRNIYELDYRRGNLLGMIEVGKKLQAFIRNRYNAHIRIDCTKGIIRRLRPRLRYRIKKSGLSHIR